MRNEIRSILTRSDRLQQEHVSYPKGQQRLQTSTERIQGQGNATQAGFAQNLPNDLDAEDVSNAARVAITIPESSVQSKSGSRHHVSSTELELRRDSVASSFMAHVPTRRAITLQHYYLQENKGGCQTGAAELACIDPFIDYQDLSAYQISPESFVREVVHSIHQGASQAPSQNFSGSSIVQGREGLVNGSEQARSSEQHEAHGLHTDDVEPAQPEIDPVPRFRVSRHSPAQPPDLSLRDMFLSYTDGLESGPALKYQLVHDTKQCLSDVQATDHSWCSSSDVILRSLLPRKTLSRAQAWLDNQPPSDVSRRDADIDESHDLSSASASHITTLNVGKENLTQKTRPLVTWSGPLEELSRRSDDSKLNNADTPKALPIFLHPGPTLQQHGFHRRIPPTSTSLPEYSRHEPNATGSIKGPASDKSSSRPVSGNTANSGKQIPVITTPPLRHLNDPLLYEFVLVPLANGQARVDFILQHSELLTKASGHHRRQALYRQCITLIQEGHLILGQQCMQCLAILQACKNLSLADSMAFVTGTLEKASTAQAEVDRLYAKLRSTLLRGTHRTLNQKASIDDVNAAVYAKGQPAEASPGSITLERLPSSPATSGVTLAAMNVPVDPPGLHKQAEIGDFAASTRLPKRFQVPYGQREIDNVFGQGSLFAIYWHENYGRNPVDGNLIKPKHAKSNVQSFTTSLPNGEAIYSHIRKFVVIQKRKGHCIALPVLAYSGRGLSPRRMDMKEYNAHCIIHESSKPPMLMPEEITFSKYPISADMTSGETLSSSSRICYSRPQSIEYNIKVKPIGKVASSSLAQMRRDYQFEHFDNG